MPDDTKDNQSVSPPPGPEKATPSSSSPAADARQSRGSEAAGVPADEAIKDATGKPVTPESGASHPERTSVPPTPEKPPAAPKPPAPAAKPPAPAAEKPAPPPKPAGPTPQPWQSDMVDRFRRRFGSGIDPKTYLGQPYITVDKSIAYEVLQIMRDEEQFDYCVDVTAVHYPKREKQEFDVFWILYSFGRNERVRIKTMIADGDTVPSVVPLWATANWLERECFDMFGIRFEGHPDMRRILLPDGWTGHPLRKEYGITQQDQQWVQINLGIESGQ